MIIPEKKAYFEVFTHTKSNVSTNSLGHLKSWSSITDMISNSLIFTSSFTLNLCLDYVYFK